MWALINDRSVGRAGSLSGFSQSVIAAVLIWEGSRLLCFITATVLTNHRGRNGDPSEPNALFGLQIKAPCSSLVVQ